MRILLDTNVLIAAFLSHGTCADLFEYCISAHDIIMPRQVMNEFVRNLSGKLSFPEILLKEAVSFLKENTETVDASPLKRRVCRDEDDDAVLSAAVAANADCVISGDEDLLVLMEFRGIPIIRPSEFWRFESRGKEE